MTSKERQLYLQNKKHSRQRMIRQVKMTKWEEHQAAENLRIARIKQKGKKRCSECGLFLCVCQSIIGDYGGKKDEQNK